ncbi:MAG: type II toxin-antitoxin system Phd/YefM family antitoxin [Proteobacteria bacterium]|nr:type II toxin-antitoxin system Phd/YefM family antitoxin [Pseudomonadota bacterium]
MKTIPAIDAKNRFGQLLDAAQREPVTVTKKGRPAAVVLSIADYERIRGAARRRLMATIVEAQREAEAASLDEKGLVELLADES